MRKARKYPANHQESSLFLLKNYSLLLTLKIKGVWDKGRYQVVENYVVFRTLSDLLPLDDFGFLLRKEGIMAKPCSIQTLLLGSFSIASLTQKSAHLSASCLNVSI